MRIGFQQQYTVLDGSHDDTEPQPNRHVVRLYWYRAQLSFFHPIAADWEAGLVVPWDRKSQKARYETPSGEPYDNPRGNLHHRTEDLEGIGDVRLLAARRGRGLLDPSDGWVLTLGLSLPTGRIEEDPFRLGAAGIRHRHIQFGTGTVDPVLGLDYSRPFGRFVLDAHADFQASLYESRERYRAAPVSQLSIGPRFPLAEGFDLSVAYAATSQGRAKWDSAKDPNSGYFQDGIRVALPMRLRDRWTVAPSVLRTITTRTRGDGDAFRMDWLFGLGIGLAF